MKGLKFRIAGIAGMVCAKLGSVPQQIAGGDIYPALEKGTIDAAEWVGPYDDQKLGFNKIAPYYYYPGWWEGGPQTSAYVNLTKWNELPKYYQSVIQAAAARAQTLMLSKYDAENPKALRELMAAGTKLLPFPQSVMEAALQRLQRALRRDLGEEPEVQEGLRKLEAVPQRGDPVVPRCRVHLRQLHGAPVGRQQAGIGRTT